MSTLENIFIFMYADDTIILAESPSDLQLALNTHNIYCQKWGLCVNGQKTKIVVFSRGKCNHSKLKFTFGSDDLDILNGYTYLGVKFNYNGKFGKATAYNCSKINKALISMLKKARNLNLPVD